MYGIAGERRLTEYELRHLPGYEGARPIRVGNAASEQFQLDVYGELVSVSYLAATRLGHIDPRAWPRWRALVDYVETVWQKPDDGIWEARGGPKHYTYSKVMAWVVFDRADPARRALQSRGAGGPLDGNRVTRSTTRSATTAMTPARNTFTQTYDAAGARRQHADDPARGVPAG